MLLYRLGFRSSILSDSNARAVYNKQGKKSAIDGAGGEEAMPDPGQIFSQMFGGKAFEDWVGEISLGKVSGKRREKAHRTSKTDDHARLHSNLAGCLESFRMYYKVPEPHK